LRKRAIRIAACAGFLLGSACAVLAQEFTFAVDVPAQFGAAYYLPNQLVKRSASGTFSVALDGPALGLGAGVRINAQTAMSQGVILFSPNVPFTAGGNTYTPRDVVYSDGASLSLWVSYPSIPPGVKIDALALDYFGQMYLSFDVPVTIGATTFMPNDLAVDNGGTLSLAYSGSALGFPAGSDVCGFEIIVNSPGNDSFFMFRTPTKIGGTTYLPMQIVKCSSGVFSLYFDGGGAAAGVIGTDFSFPAAPGAVPETPGLPGTPLRVAKSGSNLQLTWGESCVSDGNDYGIYRGTLGSWYSHTPVVCSTGGATSQTVTPGSGGEYYLAVPLNGLWEGNYGSSSYGNIEPSASPCRQYQWATCP
jgi:hypothetical protein